MTFGELITILPDNTTVYVGTNNGSGFFWISTVKYAKDNLKTMDDTLLNLSEHDRLYSKNAYEKILNSPEPVKGLIKRRNNLGAWEWVHDSESEKHFKSRVKYHKNKIKQAKDKYERIQSYINNRKFISNRNVVEHGEKAEVSDDFYGSKYRIIVEGFESGKWWFKSEFESKHVLVNG